jgi:hypothetical protein
MFAGVSTVDVIKDVSINTTGSVVAYTATRRCAVYIDYKVFNQKSSNAAVVTSSKYTSVSMRLGGVSPFIAGQTYIFLDIGEQISVSSAEAVFDLYIFSNNDDI